MDPATQRAIEARKVLVERTAEQLRSGDRKAIAQAASIVAEERLRECADDLRSALRRATSPHSYVLDALVQIDAEIPIAEFEPFAQSGAGLVLLLRQKDDRAALLRAFVASERGFTEWRALGNRLAAVPPEDFVVHLLAMPIVLQFVVSEGGTESCIAADGIRSSCWTTVKGWPPAASYEFSFEPKNGARVVVDGPFPVFATRTLAKRGGTTRFGWQSDADGCRRRWLTHALRDEADVRVPLLRQAFRVAWKDGTALNALVEAERAKVEAEWRALADACVKARLVTPTRRLALEPPVEVHVRDAREQTADPLPEVK